MSIFHLTFPKFQKNFSSGNLTFSIGNIKSRTPTVAYFIVHGYNYDGTEKLIENHPVYIGERFAVTSKYRKYVQSFTIADDVLQRIYKLELELVLVGVTSENPVWFNELMLEVGEHTEYHKPMDALEETDIIFNNNNYAVLYATNSHELQVIRPNKDKITTNKILRSKYTVLAPHIDSEPVTDTPSKLMMEFINQTEQYIQIKK